MDLFERGTYSKAALNGARTVFSTHSIKFMPSCYFIWKKYTMESTQFFVLYNFWPILKVFQILGLFPCKKVIQENGSIELKPIDLWISITLLLFFAFILTLPSVLIIFYLMTNHSEVIDLLITSQGV